MTKGDRNSRRYIGEWVLLLIFAGLVIGGVKILRDYPDILHATSTAPQSPRTATSGPAVAQTSVGMFPGTESLAEMQERTYRDPFNVNLQLQLAHAAWNKFLTSMKTDGSAGSDAGTAYMIAYMESGMRPNIYDEAKASFDILAVAAQLPSGSFDKVMEFETTMYPFKRKIIQHILSVRGAIEQICVEINADDRALQPVIAAQAAVERYLRQVYDVEIGRGKITIPDRGQLLLTPSYYKTWEQNMRSYGVVLGAYPPLALLDELKSDPFGQDAMQITKGDDFGKFVRPDGTQIVPGLRFFQNYKTPDRQQASGVNSDATSSIDQARGDASPRTPVEAYKRCLLLRNQGRWAEFVDCFDGGFQAILAGGLKSGIAAMTDNEDVRAKMASLSDRDMAIVGLKTSEIYATRIMGADVQGDQATLQIRAFGQEGGDVDGEIHLKRLDGTWKVAVPQSISSLPSDRAASVPADEKR
jgi:hypothetical protein